MNTPLTLLASLLLTTAAFPQALITVDTNGLADFTDLPPAMAAAQDGDVVVVQPGTYNGYTLDGKAVNLEADGAVTVVGTITVRNVAFDSYLAIRGITLDLQAVGGAKAGIVLEDIHGAVILEDLTTNAGTPAILLERCDDVALVDCLTGGLSGSSILGTDPYPALHCIDSSVAMHGGTYYGGDGSYSQCLGPANDIQAGNGGDAVLLDGSVLFIDNAYAVGGTGGDGCDNKGCLDGGDGGNGMYISADSSVIELGGGYFEGGPGGGPGDGAFGCSDGWWGGSWGGPGPIVFLNEDGRGLKMTSPARGNQLATLDLWGNTGDTVFLLTGIPSAPWQFHSGFSGVLVAPSFLAVTHLGSLSAPASLSLQLTVPDISPVDVASLAMQALFVSTDGTKALSPPTHVTVLAP